MRSAAAKSPPRTVAQVGSPVPLERLLGGTDVLRAQGDFGAARITAVVHDSRDVVPGALFCCLVGSRTDGHDHAAQAVADGAVALLVQRLVDVDVPQAVVADARTAMAPVAAAFFGHPSRRLAVVGVTGTNGKTTVTHLLRSVLEAGGRKAAVIGTLSGVRTTPEAPELQGRLAQLAEEGVQAVPMEVSSHALAQHRIDATWFEVVAFTNLSQDHLDYHGSMDDYFAAKASLFDPARARAAVINVGDAWGRRLYETVRLPAVPFSLADAADRALDREGSTFTWQGQRVRVRLAGEFNVVNALAAATVARELGIEPEAVAAGLEAVASVPGRFERVDTGGPVTVIVDYAHTPDGLEHALRSARQLAAAGTLAGTGGTGGVGAESGGRPGRVVVVFGCGGDRDKAKRPAMGEVATRLADTAILTSDNPRSEDPLAIIGEVRAGVRRTGVLTVEPDRRAAIALALSAARPGDVVVIAGKGHETTQVTGDEVVPFDDRQVARQELARLAS